LPDLLEHIENPVITALHDPSHYVRRTAVMGCVKLHHQNPDFVEGKWVLFYFII
jgi:vesicle coat complex subunit